MRGNYVDRMERLLKYEKSAVLINLFQNLKFSTLNNYLEFSLMSGKCHNRTTHITIQITLPNLPYLLMQITNIVTLIHGESTVQISSI